jgi:hypothetical protein
MFGKALSSYKTVRRFACCYKIGDARLKRLECLERAALHAPQDQQRRYHSSIILKSNIPGIYAWDTLYIYTLCCCV